MSKDTLHQLIHSLSTFEKGYYIKSKEDSHLTTLFNAMNKLEVYDKAVLEKRLSKHPEIVRHLAKYKNDTYTDIMKVMRSYRQEKAPNVETRLRVYLADINFLIERGLHENAMKLIKDAKKLARKYEKYNIILEIIRYEIDLSKRLYDKGYIEITRTLIEEEKQVMSMLNDECRYNEMTHLIDIAFQRSPDSNSQSRTEYLNKLMNDELLVSEERAVSFASQYQYHTIYALYYDMTGDLQKRYKHRKKIVDCWDVHPHQKHENIRSYTSSIYNYLTVCVELKKHKIFERLSDKLKKEIKPKNPYEEAIVFQRVYYSQLYYYILRGDFDKLASLIVEIQPLLKKYEKAMVSKNVYVFKIAIAYTLFVMGKYDEAYKNYNDLIKQKLPVRIDLQCNAWLFRLIIAYEQGHDNFDNVYRSTQRFFDKINPEEVGKVHLLVMEFLHRLTRSALSETKALYIEYQSTLQVLQGNEIRPTEGLNEILIWIEYMITKESQMDIYKRRVALAPVNKNQASMNHEYSNQEA